MCLDLYKSNAKYVPTLCLNRFRSLALNGTSSDEMSVKHVTGFCNYAMVGETTKLITSRRIATFTWRLFRNYEKSSNNYFYMATFRKLWELVG